MKLSQLDLLKEAVEELAKPGPESPFVKGLRAQIASIEKPRAENPMEFYSAGMRSAPTTFNAAQPATKRSLPPAPTRDNFHSQEEFEEAMGYWQGHVGRIKGMVDRAQRSQDSQPE